jgi:hypothetical protein
MKARMGVAAVWLTAIAGAGVSRTGDFKVTRFRSKAVMASRMVAALFVETQSTMCRRESGRMWISDALPTQGGDGLKGGGRFVCRSAMNDVQMGEWEDVGGFSTQAKGGEAGLQRLKCWAGRMRIVDGAVLGVRVSKPMGSSSSGNASTDCGW